MKDFIDLYLFRLFSLFLKPFVESVFHFGSSVFGYKLRKSIACALVTRISLFETPDVGDPRKCIMRKCAAHKCAMHKFYKKIRFHMDVDGGAGGGI